MSGFPSGAQTAQKIIQAWLSTDAAAINKLYAPKGTWFDDTRIRNRGLERGSEIAPALKSHYRTRYDHGSRGMAANLEAANFHTRYLGSQHIVSYDMRLNGQGARFGVGNAGVQQSESGGVYVHRG